VFSWAATQVVTAMNATHQLGGENYVLWGGREGYETLLNTDLRQEREQIGRFMQMVVEHKHKIGFRGTLLIEPKPQEPTKHQYDYDVATVYGFLKQFGLEKEIKVNIEANHATLAGHSFHHEIASAIALGIFGSVDANRGDAQLGWDTDQFPNSVEENALVMYEIIKAGGFTTGGLNFDAKVRRQSTDKYDLFYGHIGAMDTMALALKVAARMIEDGELDKRVAKRYAGWNGELGQQILKGQLTLAELAKYAEQQNLAPRIRAAIRNCWKIWLTITCSTSNRRWPAFGPAHRPGPERVALPGRFFKEPSMYIGIDLGTSGVKAILLSEQGTVLASQTEKLTVSRPHPLWSEQDPSTGGRRRTGR
jgi:xylose isomerase